MPGRRPLMRLRTGMRTFSRSLLFLPSLLTLAAIALFAATSLIDRRLGSDPLSGEVLAGESLYGFVLFAGGAGAANGLLAAVAGTWATIAGVVYSVTLVTIQLSATKYGAEAVAVFERDRFNQFVLGAFTGTFVYALLLLKTVREPGTEGGSGFVPLIGTNVAVFFAIVDLFLLIGFLGNLAAYIRPARFVANLAEAAVRAAPGLRAPEGDPGFDPIAAPGMGAWVGGERKEFVRSPEASYLTRIRWGRIARAVGDWRGGTLRLRFLVPPGTRVAPGRELIAIESSRGRPDPRLIERLEDALLFSNVRDARREPVYAAETLADVGVTALSGGATDPGLARAAVKGLLRIAASELESSRIHELFRVRAAEGTVVLQRHFPSLSETALDGALRIADRAAQAGLREVLEEAATDAGEVMKAAAGSPERAALEEAVGWLESFTDRVLEAPQEITRRRALEALGGMLVELHETGNGTAAEEAEVAIRAAAGRTPRQKEAASAIESAFARSPHGGPPP